MRNSSPLARRPPSTTSPTGSGSAAIARAPSAIARTRASSSASRSISAAESPDSRPASRSRALASRISGHARLQRVGDREQRRVLGRRVDRASRRAAALAASARSVTEDRWSDGGGHGESLGSRATHDHDPPGQGGPHATRPVPARATRSRRSTTARSRSRTARSSRPGAFADVRERIPAPRSSTAATASCCPGFVDTHVHFPQIAVIGAMGLQLLDWLAQRTLPEEARMADPAHARRTAERFVRAAGGQRDDDRARLRRPLPAGPERALRGGRRSAGCGSRAASSSPTATCAPTSRSRPRRRLRDEPRR